MKQDSNGAVHSLIGGILAGESWLTSAVSGDRIILTTWCPPRFHFYIPRESIRQLVLKDYRIAAFLRIIHDVRELPQYIRFGTFAADELKEVLKQFHYI